MRVETKSELVVDRSRHGELLRINFNMSFPQLSCEFATVDVSDALGTVRSHLGSWLEHASCPLRLNFCSVRVTMPTKCWHLDHVSDCDHCTGTETAQSDKDGQEAADRRELCAEGVLHP